MAYVSNGQRTLTRTLTFDIIQPPGEALAFETLLSTSPSNHSLINISNDDEDYHDHDHDGCGGCGGGDDADNNDDDDDDDDDDHDDDDDDDDGVCLLSTVRHTTVDNFLLITIRMECQKRGVKEKNSVVKRERTLNWILNYY